jgi:catechol 2,3-dioxygenase-like lactoylglutathione lyase family enzyme
MHRKFAVTGGMITGMRSMAILVHDAKKAAEWYREKLGFEADIQGHWVTVWPKGSNLKLHLCEKCKEWGEDSPGGQTGIQFTVDNKEQTHQELKDRGVEFSQDLTTEWYGTFAIFKDIDGNEFWI